MDGVGQEHFSAGDGLTWLGRPLQPLGLVLCVVPVPDPLRDDLAGVLGLRRLACVCIDAAAGTATGSAAGDEQAIVRALDALHQQPALAALPFGLFGMGPACGAALLAAAVRRARLQAVVACGGRLEHAFAALPMLPLPTLLIVGGDDLPVLASHRSALRLLPGLRRLETVPGAGPGFPEPGSLETALHLAASWFGTHLAHQH